MQKFAVFDIDGTLIRWQLYHTLVDRLAKEGVLGKEAHRKLHDARMRWKRREAQYSFSDYETTLIHLYEASLSLIPTRTFDKIVSAVTEEYKDQVYTYTRDLIGQLKQSGYFLIAISGSHQELVEIIASHHNFDVCVGSAYEREDGAFSGRMTVASHHKKAILESLLKKYNLTLKESYAVGDSKSDAPMLAMVKNPIAFNPDAQLFKTAQLERWNIVVERKNMIYELEYKNGAYVLAKAG